MSTKAKKAAVKSANKPSILVYCGPAIPHICGRFSMFSAVPDALPQMAEAVPLIRNLILPISELRDARQQIEGKSGPLYAIYLEVQKSI
jgi:hypothetical protein